VLLNNLLIGLGIAALALVLALAVIVPVFLAVHWLYDDGDGLLRLLIGIVLSWLLLALLLRRRRVVL
jgi:hypothetical protein